MVAASGSTIVRRSPAMMRSAKTIMKRFLIFCVIGIKELFPL